MSASTWPLSRQTALDLNGEVVPFARLYFFKAGTTTPLEACSDPDLTVPLPAFPDPILADANGRWPRIYLPYEDYRERVTTPDGILLWDDDGIANPPPPANAGSIPESKYVQTGTVILGLGVLDGYLALNGQTIGNGVSGATARASDDTLALYTHIWNSVVDAIAPVAGGRGTSAQVDFAAGKTIGLPNFQGRSLTGLIGMGGSASTVLDAVTFTTGTKTQAGAQFGAAEHTLTQAQLPVITPAGTIGGTVTTTDPATTTETGSTAAPQSNNYWSGTGSSAKSISATFTGSSFGSGNAHPNTQPSGLVYVLVKL
jgi:hypothetical protein